MLLPSLKLTFLPLKIDGWKMNFSFLGPGLFSVGETLSFRDFFPILPSFHLPFEANIYRKFASALEHSQRDEKTKISDGAMRVVAPFWLIERETPRDVPPVELRFYVL